ncbi:hypothetical protein AAFF_G00047830 [Aldrovandia affinis]|uniref:Ig-like domain-containing protein n=1 Tax=Aldrovandia affinis TaxID=143900 RepID=A0AAD7R2L0_9TELE|nr:hypothetical protein AAFF_G00047830 [Aldrovandia affinis]
MHAFSALSQVIGNQSPKVYQCGSSERIAVAAVGSITNVTVGQSVLTLYRSEYSKPHKYSRFHLQVFECVSKPNITAECRSNNISLSCSSSRGTEVTYSWETVPPAGNGSCVHMGQTMEMYPLPPSESTTYTCTAQNPVSRATSDPIDRGVCSIQQPQDRRWIPAVCGLSAFILTLLLLLFFLYWRNHRNKRSTYNNN